MSFIIKSISTVTVASSLFIGFIAKADCQVDYQILLRKAQVEQKRNTIKSVGLTILSLLFPPAGVAKLGSLALQSTVTVKGVKIYFSKHELERIARLLDQANNGSGPELELALEIVKRDRPETDLKWVTSELQKMNHDNLYCTSEHLASFEEIMLSLGVEQKTAEKALSLIDKIKPIQADGPVNSLEVPPTIISENEEDAN